MKLNKKAPIMVARIVMANTLKMFFKNTLTLSEKPASNMMGGSKNKKKACGSKLNILSMSF